MEMENEICPELISIHSLNFLSNNDSSARAVMFASHFSQRLVTDKSDPKVIQTGVEYEMAKYTFCVKMPADGTIIKIIDRYPRTADIDSIPFNPEKLVIYEDATTKEIGSFTMPYHLSYHQYFGFKLIYTENAERLTPGQFIPKDTVFAHSSSIGDNGVYKYGRSMNVAMMSHPAGAEDGVMISESGLEKLRFSVFETRVVEFGPGNFPLNLYGNVHNYKIFPDIGETIRPDGILMMLRKTNVNNSPVDIGIYDVMEPDFMFDTAYYVRGPGGVIVDIKVYKDDTAQNCLPDNMVAGFQKYVKGLRNYYSEIVKTELEIIKQRKAKYGSDKISIAPPLHRLIVEGLAVLNRVSHKHSQKLKILYRKAPLSEYRVVFTIEYKLKPTIGFKITDSHGGKGVICRTVKDECMPVDADGNRAEIIMEFGSTISRMNLGRLYEQYIGASARDFRKRLQRMFGYTIESKAAVMKLLKKPVNIEPVAIARGLLLEYFECISPAQHAFVGNMSEANLIEYLADILADDLYIFYPVDNPLEPMDVIRKLEAKFPTTYGPVKYIGYDGKEVVTNRNVRIGPMYIMILEKIADVWSAVSYGKLQHFGVLSLMTKSEKYTYPFHNNPVRTIGESEARVFVGYCGQDTMAEMMDRSNSILTQKHMAWNLLSADKPTDIKNLVDRRLIGYGGSRPIQLLNHIAICSGWRPKYVRESNS